MEILDLMTAVSVLFFDRKSSPFFSSPVRLYFVSIVSCRHAFVLRVSITH